MYMTRPTKKKASLGLSSAVCRILPGFIHLVKAGSLFRRKLNELEEYVLIKYRGHITQLSWKSEHLGRVCVHVCIYVCLCVCEGLGAGVFPS